MLPARARPVSQKGTHNGDVQYVLPTQQLEELIDAGEIALPVAAGG